jgi:hypothetical protein
MCYNFLLLFLSGFKKFLAAYTLAFFLVFILQEFLEEQYHSLILSTDSIKEESYEIFQRGDLNRFLGFPLGPISTTSTTPYVDFPVKTASLTGCSPLPRTCVVVA